MTGLHKVVLDDVRRLFLPRLCVYSGGVSLSNGSYPLSMVCVSLAGSLGCGELLGSLDVTGLRHHRPLRRRLWVVARGMGRSQRSLDVACIVVVGVALVARDARLLQVGSVEGPSQL